MILQLSKTLSVVTLRPFDTSNELGRSKERYRRLAMTGLVSVGLRLVSACFSLLSVPLTVNYLGSERYGLWMTISSIIALLGFADLGLGNSLLNSVAEASGRDDKQLARSLVSTAFFVLVAVSIVGSVGFAALYPVAPWPKIFNVTSPSAVAEAGPALAILVGCFFVGLPFTVVQRVQSAYQEGFASNLWQIGSATVGILALLLVVHNGGGTPWLVVAASGANGVVLCVNWIVHFTKIRPWLRPRLANVERKATSAIVTSGSMFLLLQVCLISGTASDALIIAQILGPKEVAIYSVVQRLFSVTALAYMFITPLWPAIGEALSRGDGLWIRSAACKTLVLGLAATTPVALILTWFGIPIIQLWTRSDIRPAMSLLWAAGAFCVFNVAVAIASVILNQPALLKKHVGFYVLASLAAPVLKIGLVRNFGSAGVFWGAMLAYGILWGIPAVFLIRAAFSELLPRTSGKSCASVKQADAVSIHPERRGDRCSI